MLLQHIVVTEGIQVDLDGIALIACGFNRDNHVIVCAKINL